MNRTICGVTAAALESMFENSVSELLFASMIGGVEVDDPATGLSVPERITREISFMAFEAIPVF